ncbi:MAG: hypothetical protein WBQ50_00285 [Nocardioides sp.]
MPHNNADEVAERDFTGFQHAHPTLAQATGGDPLILGPDLAVVGDYR